MAGKLLFSTIGLLSRRFIAASLDIRRSVIHRRIEAVTKKKTGRETHFPPYDRNLDPTAFHFARTERVGRACFRQKKFNSFSFDRAKLTDQRRESRHNNLRFFFLHM